MNGHEFPGRIRTRYIQARKLKPKVRQDGSYYVLTGVFLPREAAEGEYVGRMELSSFGIDGLEEDEVWGLGFDQYLPSGRSLKGRADLETEVFLLFGLTFIPQLPPEKHGSFIGWPAESEELQAISLELATNASAHPHPDGKDSPRKP